MKKENNNSPQSYSKIIYTSEDFSTVIENFDLLLASQIPQETPPEPFNDD